MTSPKFDRARPFGQIHPPFNGAQFEQGGNYFAGNGDFLFREGGAKEAAAPAAVSAPQEPPAPPAPPPAPEPNPEPEPAPAPAAEPADSHGGSADSEPVENFKPADLIVEEVNLTKWAKGEEAYPFFAVKKAAAAYKHDIDTKNAKAIVAGLVEYGVIGADEAKK